MSAPHQKKQEDQLHADLAQFLDRVKEYEPTTNEEICRYYMQLGGVRIDETDKNQDLTLKLVALATDHFVAGIVHDAGEFAHLRMNPRSKTQRRPDNCLRIGDVMLALERRGVTTLQAIPSEDQVQQAASGRGSASQKRARETHNADISEPPHKRIDAANAHTSS
ncbi:hypothetical protein CTAYLR_000213 [Chrysophaeum taylorii]|uniref:Transcription initiation factor TFIID subunit 10 n=1 Tax=Chrysophaeum taylorii TaxID=2483200 RepID=A0AAD7UGV2_9STRA|nr:hypothetical protein CTAYLR_000213 [Chrysophaeum taylorii]